MKTKQHLILFATITMLTTLVIPMFIIGITQAADPTDWYMTTEGVLDTDYYDLYPYVEASVDFGLSRYGEMIDSETNIGLEYAGLRDPFAAPAGAGLVSKLPKNVWINGWYIDITYNHQSWGRRNVWAGALFGDLTNYGGPWIRVDNTYDPSYSTETGETFKKPGYEVDADGSVIGSTLMYGGRKTNGTATTGVIQVLYDGPRKFVAMVSNRIYDYHQPSQTMLALVDVKLTFIFDKVDKQVVILKDVKLLDQPKFVMQPLTIGVPESSPVVIPAGLLIQFSNREEWDLGSAPEYSSYAHYYTAGGTADEALDTAYNDDWTLLQTLPPGYTLDGTAMALYGSEPKSAGTYDMAQVISNDGNYVGFVAHWPSVSDWTVNAGDDDIWWRRMVSADQHRVDGTTEPWLAPLTVGEWDFVLAETAEPLGVPVAEQFRGVSVYGVTDQNDGADADNGSSNVIDKEAMYQLDKHFNPWSLVDAVTKDTKNTSRWWDEFTGTSYSFVPAAVDVADADWDAYGVFSERVTVKATGQLVPRSQYTFSTSGISGLPSSTYVVRWSSDNWTETIDGVAFGTGRYEWTTIGRDAKTIDSAGASLITASIKQKNITIGLAGSDMWDPDTTMQMPSVMYQFGVGDTKEDYKDAIGRAALTDNWCTYWPTSSSNMIGVGGPVANMLSYYSNDFTDAIYGIPEYATGSPYSGMITGLACWQRYWDDIADGPSWNVYSSYDDPTVGYAVISTYIDKNGTEVIVVWGHFGRDTYYATQWLHGDAARDINPGILQLQQAPAGLTSIILQIDYTDPNHPTFCIPELLGTISETEWVHEYTNIYTGATVVETKGGIHDP
ncbi:MAG: hypothetical protein CW691_02665 [Candidatus Bathyarchaeum sp.]|nr:MAG: hypothetical protein CW691_02665 [Candidatus Bathyarchaeum sp.]